MRLDCKKGRPALRAYVKALHQLQKAYDALPSPLRPLVLPC